MPVAQMFQTTAVSEQKGLSVAFLSIPSSSVDERFPSNAQETVQVLGGEYLRQLSPEDLPSALSLALSSPAHTAAAALGRSDTHAFDLAIEPPIFESPERFSKAILDEVLIPIAQSPIELKSLNALLSTQSGMAMGATAALVGFWGSPILIIAVPTGIVLGGAAEGLSKALNKGLRRRIERLLLGKR